MVFAVEIFARRPLLRNEITDVVRDIELVADCVGVLGRKDFRRVLQRLKPAQGGRILRADPVAV